MWTRHRSGFPRSSPQMRLMVTCVPGMVEIAVTMDTDSTTTAVIIKPILMCFLEGCFQHIFPWPQSTQIAYMDKVSPRQRHANMAAIHSSDTRPEMIVRRWLHSRGFRYRLNHRGLPGHPDIVLRKYRTCIFVNGCFWHGHEGCRYFRLPKTNVDFWRTKIPCTSWLAHGCHLGMQPASFCPSADLGVTGTDSLSYFPERQGSQACFPVITLNRHPLSTKKSVIFLKMDSISEGL